MANASFQWSLPLEELRRSLGTVLSSETSIKPLISLPICNSGSGGWATQVASWSVRA